MGECRCVCFWQSCCLSAPGRRLQLRVAFAQSEPLQPGDTLQISVWQDPKLDRQVVVGPDGMISFPLAGHIKAGGITPQASKICCAHACRKTTPSKLDITVSLAAVNPTEAADNQARASIFPARCSSPALIPQAADRCRAGHCARRRPKPVRGQPPHPDPPQGQGADTVLVFDYKAFQSGTGAPDDNIRSAIGRRRHRSRTRPA